MTEPARKKIAILGGGPSALACAYFLTWPEELRGKYEITIYSMGWKLGGKGSSGRGAFGRIEEHGLHILFGAYHSFFKTLRDCYRELDRPPGHPLRTWRDAFKPHDFGVVEDYFEGRWCPWMMEFPSNRALPGEEGTAVATYDYLSMAMQATIEAVFGWRLLHRLQQRGPVFRYRGRAGIGADLGVRAAVRLLALMLRVGSRMAGNMARRQGLLLRILARLRQLVWPRLRRLSEVSIRSNRFWLGVDFTVALLTGVLVDGVLEEGGFEKIDHLDFRKWLEGHGAHPLSLEGPWGRSIYDAAFSYADGNPKTQSIAAGVAVRLFFGFGLYRGHMYFKMQTGMGDAVFAPLYLVLKSRGVKFEQFRKIESLHLSEDHKRIERVTGTIQARLKPDISEYSPLEVIKGLECWPSEPRYEQLEHADELRGVDLESYYQQPPHAEPFELRAGHDFDQLVFGIPIGAVPLLCGELLDRSERWRAMVEHVTSVQTLSFQIWTKRDLRGLGWTMPPPLLSLYVEPLNTWSDMSQVLGTEAWPRALSPGSVSYFTGPQLGPKYAPAPADDPDFESRQTAIAKEAALAFLRHSVLSLLPSAAAVAGGPGGERAAPIPGNRAEFDWNELVDPDNGKGAARFDRQYWRSNCGPSERCTLALPGSIRHRMQAGDTDFDNLVITGDWIDNGIYAACMEGAFNAGILAARAVSGYPFQIDGLGYAMTRGPLHPPHHHPHHRDPRPGGRDPEER